MRVSALAWSAIIIGLFGLRSHAAEFAPDGTPVVKLATYKELQKMSDVQVKDYIENVRISVLHYEKTVLRHFTEAEFAQLVPINPALLKLIVGQEARAEDLNPTAGEWTRCIYAGWSILGKKCEAKKSVEYDVHVYVKTTGGSPQSTFVKVSLSCPSGKTLCNPVVFGVVQPSKAEELGGPYPENSLRPPSKQLSDLVKSKVKPLCVSSSDRRNTSRECYYAAREMKAFADPKGNPQLWGEFEGGFNKMCGKVGISENPYFKNRPRAIQDMQDTCAWIKRQLDSGSGPDQTRRKSYGPDRGFDRRDQKSNESTINR